MIRQDNLHTLVSDELRKRIVYGDLLPGEKIQEERWAEEFKISRTPLKFALIQLAEDGIVELIPRRGAYVKTLTIADFREIYSVRLALEDLAIRTAVLRLSGDGAPEADPSTLLEAADSFTRACLAYEQEGDPHRRKEIRRTYIDLDHTFHDRLIELSGNRYLTGLFRRTHLLYTSYVHALADIDQDIRFSSREHHALASAIMDRDVATAIGILREHLAPERLAMRSPLEEP